MIFYLMLFLAMAAWGGSWISGKVISKSMDFQVIVLMRLVLTLISFVPLLFVFRQSLKISKDTLLRIFLTSLVMVAINQLYFMGLQNGLAGIGGVLVPTLNPVLVFLLTLLLYHQKFHLKNFLIVFLGFIGGLLILEVWNISYVKLLASGNLFYIFCALAWAIFTLLGNSCLKKTSIWVYSFYLYLFGALMQLFFSLPFSLESIAAQGGVFWGNLLFISFFAGTFSTTVYFLATQKIGAYKASSFSFLVPFGAVLLSWLVLGEKPALSTIAGGLVALTSVYWINRVRKSNAL